MRKGYSGSVSIVMVLSMITSQKLEYGSLRSVCKLVYHVPPCSISQSIPKKLVKMNIFHANVRIIVQYLVINVIHRGDTKQTV